MQKKISTKNGNLSWPENYYRELVIRFFYLAIMLYISFI